MREKLIKVRLSEDEWMKVKDAADFAGHKVAAWARGVIVVASRASEKESSV